MSGEGAFLRSLTYMGIGPAWANLCGSTWEGAYLDSGFLDISHDLVRLGIRRGKFGKEHILLFGHIW